MTSIPLSGVAPAADYSWLETDDPASLDWQDQQTRRARSYLDALPDRDGVSALVEQWLDDDHVSVPIVRNGRWFERHRLNPGDEKVSLTVRDGRDDPPRTLLDPNRLGKAIRWFEPSPDGGFLLAGIAAPGSEDTQPVLIDATTGRQVEQDLPHSGVDEAVWFPNSEGFGYLQRIVVEGETTRRLFLHTLHAPSPPPEVLPPGPNFGPLLIATSQTMAIVGIDDDLRLVRDDDGTWRTLPVDDAIDQAEAVLLDDAIIAIVNTDHPTGQLVRIPLASAADRDTWTVLVPASRRVLRTLHRVAGSLVLCHVTDTVSGLTVLEPDGTSHDVPLPGRGTVASSQANGIPNWWQTIVPGDGGFCFGFVTFDQSMSVYRYDLQTRELTQLQAPTTSIPGLTVRTVYATSRDGVRVPATVVHRGDLDLAGPQPTVINGYGGFGLGMLPRYLGPFAPFVCAGGIFVLAHLRGGGEFGADWWQQGRKEHKQHTFDDLFAIAEHLIDTGLTAPDRLAFQGGSNGGLTAGAAITQRPELWAAVAANVPILDLINLVRDPLTLAIAASEYGDPRQPQERATLLTYSPVHCVDKDVAYPAVLLTAGATDPRCPPWHPRKFLAQLLDATTSDAPVLLSIRPDEGHALESRSVRSAHTTDWIAFLMHHTGLRPLTATSAAGER